ncbi:hypothetical protein JCM10212_004761 [Sporobolomyces blumeae]
MATAILNHLLSHQLATNDLVAQSIHFVLDSVATQRLVERAELEEGTQGPVLHRWQLRLTSLLSASNSSTVRAAGFRLLHQTYTSSTSILLSSGKQTLTAAQTALATPSTKFDPVLFGAALECARLIVAKSTWHPEWARENVGAQVVQKFVANLVQAAEGSVSEVQVSAVSTICTLIPLFPTALRPLSPSLHTLALSILCDPSLLPAATESAAHLFVSLYLLAPKGKEGLREAWRTGIEALTASIDELVRVVSSEIFSEDAMTNHSLSPLALPPLHDPTSPFLALDRLETLSKVLLLALRTPTTEKAGPVQVPIGALVELGTRLVSMNSESPMRERVDPTVRTLTLSLLPRVQIVGCQLLAQVGLTVGSHLTVHSSMVLATVARTLNTYPVRSPMRPALSTTYSLLLSAIGASLDPDEASKSLARVWRTVLEDISSVALEPALVTSEKGKPGQAGSGGGNGRKNKRVKTSYDPSESMVDQRAAVDERDLEIAEKGLATLERLLRCPSSYFLPPSLQLATSRLLLYISLSPTFFSLASLPSTSTATFYPATSASRSLEIAKQSASFRRGVVRALRASVESGVGGVGTAERAAQVWARGILDADDEIKLCSLAALDGLSRAIHPIVPPQLANETLTRVRDERHGGPVGDEESWSEGVDEFRRRDGVPRRHGDSDDDEGSDRDGDDDEQDKESKRKTPQLDGPASFVSFAPPANTTTTTTIPASSASFAPTPSFGAGSTSQGFASFAAPSFGTTAAPKPLVDSTASNSLAGAAATTESAPAPRHNAEIEKPTPAPVLSFSTETVTKKVDTAAPRRAAEVRPGEGDDDDSDDDMMPAIDLGSDAE